MPAQGRAQVNFTVGAGGSHASIQAAVKACPPAGCIISITDTVVPLAREVWIEGKTNIVIRAADNLKAAGIRPRLWGISNFFDVPGTADMPTDPLRPAGWKRWPIKGTGQTGLGAAGNTANQYSTSGFQHNGFIVVYKSTNIRIEGLRIDGKRPLTFRNTGIWDDRWDVFFGNVGINLFQSKSVEISNCEIENFFAAIYMQNRNVGGAFAMPNPNDNDVASIVPYSQYGKVGRHLIEKNYIRGNWYGFYDEMEWDLGSTIRYNVFHDNFNTQFAQNQDSAADANNMTGGLMYEKDNSIAPHKIYNNTIHGSSVIFGLSYFKSGVQHYFYNNLMTGWNRAGKNGSMMDNDRQMLKRWKHFLYNNTFEVATDSAFQKQTMGQANLVDATLADPNNPSKTCTGGCWITWDTPVPVLTGIQMNQALWSGWEAGKGGNYIGTFLGKTYSVKNDQVVDMFGVNAAGPIISSQGLGTAPYNIAAQKNYWARKVPYQSLLKSSPNFFEPVWSSLLVDSTIQDEGWDAAGTRDADNSIPDRGAIPRFKGSVVSALNLADQSIVTLDPVGKKVSFRYCLDGAAGTWSNLKFTTNVYFSQVAAAFTTAAGSDPFPKRDWSVPVSLTPKGPGAAPTINSCGTYTADLPVAPVDSLARIDLIAEGELNGATVKSNPGVWIWRKTTYVLDAFFTRPGTMDTIKSVRVGETADMHVRAIRVDNAAGAEPTISVLTANPDKPTYLATGNTLIEQGATIGQNVTSAKAIPVYFTKTGVAEVVMSGLIGTLPVPGSATIVVRPGLPDHVEWQNPTSYKFVQDSLKATFATEIPQAPTALQIRVLDKFDNPVDTAATVQVTMRPAGLITSIGLGGTVSGPFVTNTYPTPWTFQSDATGSVTPAILVAGVPGERFVGYASVVGLPSIDSTPMKVGKLLERLQFQSVVAIDTFITVKQPVTIILTQDGTSIMTTSPFATSTVRLSSSLGTSFYASATDVTPVDTAVLVGGKVTLWVTSMSPLTADTLKASNLLLGNGLPALYAPVTWKPVPAPPAPEPISASFVDFNCDGYADSIDIVLKNKLKPAIKMDSLRLAYGTTDTWLKTGWRLYPDSTRLRLALPVASTVRGNLTGSNVQIGYTVSRPPVADTSYTTKNTTPISDKVQPALMDTAYIVENFTRATQADTLKVTFTEPVNFSEAGWAFAVVNGAGLPVATTTLVPVSATVNPADARSWTIVFNGNTAGSLVAQGYKIRLLPTAAVSDLAANTPAGAECSPGVPVVEVPSPVPVTSAWLKSTAGNGRADRLFIKLAKPVSRSLRRADLPVTVRLAWGGGSDTAWAVAASFIQSADSTIWEVPVGPMAFGVTRGFNADGTGALQILGNGRNELVAVQDSVSPIPVRAVMSFGDAGDTVTVTYSEPMKLAAVNGDYMVWKNGTGIDQGMSVTSLPTMLDESRWAFPLTTSPNNPAPGDSTRLPLAGSKLVAGNGTQPSSTVLSPYVLIVGGDRPPSFAWYKDTDADGRIDYVGMRFTQPIKTSPSFRFRFGAEEKTIDATSGLVFDPTGYKAEVRLAVPFAPGSTFVDPAAKLGTMISGMEDVVLATPFAIVDSVDPVILSAKLSFPADYSAGQRDTLRLKFSEPVILSGTKENLVWVPRPLNAHAYNHLPGTIQVAPDEVWMFADTSSRFDLLGSNDSIRVAPRDLGGELTDLSGNAPLGALAKWTPIQAGQRPPHFEMRIYPSPVMKIDEATPDVAGFGLGPQMTVWISKRGKDAADTAMYRIDGNGNQMGGSFLAPMLPGKAIGPRFSLNGPFQATALIYDNMGVFVGSTTLELDSTAILNNGYAGKDGNFEVAILWNGKNAKGELVGSGIYMFRVVVYRDLIDEATQQKIRTLALNLVTKVGINIPLKK